MRARARALVHTRTCTRARACAPARRAAIPQSIRPIRPESKTTCGFGGFQGTDCILHVSPIRPIRPRATRGGRRAMIAELLEELRARGIELHANGATLRVVGSKGAYSAAIRARLLASKPEILEHLRRVEESAAARYDREERAWAAEYLAHLAVARGYSEELARAAATIVGQGAAARDVPDRTRGDRDLDGRRSRGPGPSRSRRQARSLRGRKERVLVPA